MRRERGKGGVLRNEQEEKLKKERKEKKRHKNSEKVTWKGK